MLSHYPSSYLDSIYWRSTDIHGHLAGKSVFVAGYRGFYGSWAYAFFTYLRDERGIDVRISGASRREGFNIIQTRTYPDTLKSADYVINCAGATEGLSEVELKIIHGAAPGWLRLHMAEDATLLHFSSGAAGNPCTPYARAKWDGEQSLGHYNGTVQIIRPFATVGPGMGVDKKSAISTFIAAKLAGHPLEIPPRPVVRSFVHIADLMVQALHVMVHGDGKPYEVGSDDPLEITDAAYLISDDVRESDREFPSNAGVDEYVADLTRVRGQFNLSLDWDSRRAVLDAARYYGVV